LKEIFKVQGMHCKSCELAIEDSVKKIDGVTRAKANTNKKTLLVEGESWRPSDVEKAVNKAGYYLGEEKQPLFSRNKWDYIYLMLAFVVLFVLYGIFSAFGLSKYINFTPQGITSLWLVLGIGLTAGVSTCMAVVGGLVLGISARHAEKYPDATPAQKFRPQLFFNAGRIFFYTVFGAIIGLLGGVIRISADWNGFLTIVIGLVMILLGIQISGIFPGFASFFTLPSGIARMFGITNEKEYSHSGSFILGGLTFFLPCGFTQAMQLLAVSSASPIKGAAIMGVFALGTAPGLLGVGALTSFLKKGRLSVFFYKFIALLIIFMAVYNIQNGLNLIGYQSHHSDDLKTTKAVQAPPTVVGATAAGMTVSNAQTFKASFSNADVQNTIQPNQFTVKVGKPVRIEILAKEDGLGCMSTVMIPGILDNPQYFKKDQTTVLEFTPQKTGTFKMTCAMGVQSGEIIVVN
jgi:uncharacterized protein